MRAKNHSLAGSRILVVDDSRTNIDVLRGILEPEGYNITFAMSGEQALRLAPRLDIDLILLDVMMPGMSGYEVLEEIKGDMDLRAIPVIMVSALDDMESVVKCIDLGAEDYLPKPFDPTLLRARVAASLDKKRLGDQAAAGARTASTCTPATGKSFNTATFSCRSSK